MLTRKTKPFELGRLERLILRARRHYEHEGYSRLWIDQRMRSVSGAARADQRMVPPRRARFRAVPRPTNELFVAAFGMDVEAYRRYKGLFRTRENLRDHMTDIELSLVSLAETTTVELHRRRRSSGFEAMLLDAKDAGKIIARTRRDIEAESGAACRVRCQSLATPTVPAPRPSRLKPRRPWYSRSLGTETAAKSCSRFSVLTKKEGNQCPAANSKLLESRRYLASVTASFNAATGVLTIVGDAKDNDIVVSQNSSGGIEVESSTEKKNGKKAKKDKIKQTLATVANTALIQIFADAGDDAIDVRRGQRRTAPRQPLRRHRQRHPHRRLRRRHALRPGRQRRPPGQGRLRLPLRRHRERHAHRRRRRRPGLRRIRQRPHDLEPRRRHRPQRRRRRHRHRRSQRRQRRRSSSPPPPTARASASTASTPRRSPSTSAPARTSCSTPTAATTRSPPPATSPR